MTLYKAVRPDGTSFYDPEFRWVPESGPVQGIVVQHPDPDIIRGAAGALSVSRVATDCTGMRWPCRLLEVEIPTRPRTALDGLSNKVLTERAAVVDELPATEALGPQGVQVAQLIETLATTGWSAVDSYALRAAWAAWSVHWPAAESRVVRAAAAERAAAGLAARKAVEYEILRSAPPLTWDWGPDEDYARLGWAAVALAMRDLIPVTTYNELTMPLRQIGLRLHPDDPEATFFRTTRRHRPPGGDFLPGGIQIDGVLQK